MFYVFALQASKSMVRQAIIWTNDAYMRHSASLGLMIRYQISSPCNDYQSDISHFTWYYQADSITVYCRNYVNILNTPYFHSNWFLISLITIDWNPVTTWAPLHQIGPFQSWINRFSKQIPEKPIISLMILSKVLSKRYCPLIYVVGIFMPIKGHAICSHNQDWL